MPSDPVQSIDSAIADCAAKKLPIRRLVRFAIRRRLTPESRGATLWVSTDTATRRRRGGIQHAVARIPPKPGHGGPKPGACLMVGRSRERA